MRFKNSVPSSKKTPCTSVARIGWLMQFNQYYYVYSEDHLKCINTFRRQNAELVNVKAYYAQSYYRALKGYRDGQFPKWTEYIILKPGP
jgi:hypothetical protein